MVIKKQKINYNELPLKTRQEINELLETLKQDRIVGTWLQNKIREQQIKEIEHNQKMREYKRKWKAKQKNLNSTTNKE